MKKFGLISGLFLLLAAPVLAYVPYENSPMNWNNNSMNYENSSMNFKNSPMNWDNSPMNPNAANIIYDNNGNARGYAVPKSNGTGVNVYDFKGNRVNYFNY